MKHGDHRLQPREAVSERQTYESMTRPGGCVAEAGKARREGAGVAQDVRPRSSVQPRSTKKWSLI